MSTAALALMRSNCVRRGGGSNRRQILWKEHEVFRTVAAAVAAAAMLCGKVSMAFALDLLALAAFTSL